MKTKSKTIGDIIIMEGVVLENGLQPIWIDVLAKGKVICLLRTKTDKLFAISYLNELYFCVRHRRMQLCRHNFHTISVEYFLGSVRNKSKEDTFEIFDKKLYDNLKIYSALQEL